MRCCSAGPLYGLALLTAGALLCGCASTTHGPPARGLSTAAAATTATFATSGVGLGCAGADVVSPAGAPYCYPAPAGLPAIDLGAPVAGEQGSFRTSFGLGPTDHVDVQVYDVGMDTDHLDDAEITAQLGGVVTALEAGGFDFSGTPAARVVGGARGFSYAGASTDGDQRLMATFVFRGSTEVQVNCAVTDHADLIDTACRAVLAGMHITG